MEIPDDDDGDENDDQILLLLLLLLLFSVIHVVIGVITITSVPTAAKTSGLACAVGISTRGNSTGCWHGALNRGTVWQAHDL